MLVFMGPNIKYFDCETKAFQRMRFAGGKSSVEQRVRIRA